MDEFISRVAADQTNYCCGHAPIVLCVSSNKPYGLPMNAEQQNPFTISYLGLVMFVALILKGQGRGFEAVKFVLSHPYLFRH